MDSEPQKPYIRYIIEGEVSEKGIGFSIEKAVQSFIDAQKFKAQVRLLKKTSNECELMVEVFDIDRLYFNMQTLLDHIEKSGRLPTNSNYKPKVTIKPVPCDYSLPEIEDKKEEVSPDLAWMKTVESMQKQLQEKDKRLNSREDLLKDAREKVVNLENQIGEYDTENRKLEDQIRSSAPLKFKNPVSPMLEGYLRYQQENLIDCCDDWERLPAPGKEIITRYSFEHVKELDLRIFMNIVYGTKFVSAEEMKRWFEVYGKTSSWEETAEGKEYARRRDQIDVDRKALDGMKEQGVSPSLISVVEQALSEEDTAFQKIEEGREDAVKGYEKHKKIASQYEDIEIIYNEINDILKRAGKRKEKRHKFSILLSNESCSVDQVRESKFRLFVPTFSDEFALEKTMHDYLKNGLEELGLEYEVADDENYDRNNCKVYTIHTKEDVNVKVNQEAFDKSYVAVLRFLYGARERPLIRNLGINLEVITMDYSDSAARGFLVIGDEPTKTSPANPAEEK